MWFPKARRSRLCEVWWCGGGAEEEKTANTGASTRLDLSSPSPIPPKFPKREQQSEWAEIFLFETSRTGSDTALVNYSVRVDTSDEIVVVVFQNESTSLPDNVRVGVAALNLVQNELEQG